jgi:hypothetical protein
MDFHFDLKPNKSKELKPIFILTTILTCILFTSSSCKKSRDNPIDPLPPETQTGANTFGCFVNGQVFTNGGSGGSLSAIYQFTNGGYNLKITAGKGDINPASIGISTDSLQISQGFTYPLRAKMKGAAYAEYFNPSIGVSINSILYKTKELIYNGQLMIKKLDSVNQIISGNFWFNAVNANGD